MCARAVESIKNHSALSVDARSIFSVQVSTDQMHLEVSHPSESSVTHDALMRFLSGVFPPVNFQSTFPQKCLATDCTLVRSRVVCTSHRATFGFVVDSVNRVSFLVNHYMRFESFLTVERLTAFCTQTWPLFTMSFQMVRKGAPVGTFEIAQITLKWFLSSVNFHVFSQRPRNTASVGAHTALERLVSRVNLRVHLQMTGTCAFVVANGATIRLFTRVNSDVNSQVTFCNKRLSTDVTLEGSFSCVGTNVSFQITLFVERFPTSVTNIRFLSCMYSHVPGELPGAGQNFVTHETLCGFTG